MKKQFNISQIAQKILDRRVLKNIAGYLQQPLMSGNTVAGGILDLVINNFQDSAIMMAVLLQNDKMRKRTISYYKSNIKNSID
jgi:hypothetical protein